MRRTLSKMAVVLIGLAVPFALGSAAASAYGPAPGATITVRVSQAANGVVTLSVTGARFGSNETVDFTVYNPPLSAGSAMTTASGTLSTSIVLPAGLSRGSHTLIASGTASGKTASATFVLAQTSGAAQPCIATTAALTSSSEITEADVILTASCRSQVPASGGTQASGGGSTAGASSSAGGFTGGAAAASTPQASGGLAFTGTDATALVAAAAAALALGGMLVLSSRRRQHSNWG